MTGQLELDLFAVPPARAPRRRSRRARGPVRGWAPMVDVRWGRCHVWRRGRYRKVRTVRVRGGLL